MLSSTLSYSEGKSIDVGESFRSSELIPFNEMGVFSSQSGIYSGRIGASYKVVGSLNWLSWYIPLGIRRFAIGPQATFMTAKTSSQNINFSQVGLSVDVEVLANHTYPVLGSFGFFSETSGSLVDSLSFKLSQEF